MPNLFKKILITVAITSSALFAMDSFWVRADFVEPGFSPDSSDQDFAQNILGANNDNNDFDSSNVSAENDGSIIERLEYLSSPVEHDLFFEGGEPYYCSRLSVTDGLATTTAINNGSICKSGKTCAAGICQ